MYTGAASSCRSRSKPAAELNHLEEVLVITQKLQREPSVSGSAQVRAADILAQRLPSVPDVLPSVPGNTNEAGNAGRSREANNEAASRNHDLCGNIRHSDWGAGSKQASAGSGAGRGSIRVGEAGVHGGATELPSRTDNNRHASGSCCSSD